MLPVRYALPFVACVFLSFTPELSAAPSKEETHEEEGGAEEKKKGDEEALTCAEEPIGDWMVAYDAHEFRVWNQAAEMTWKISTHLDPETTSGFLVKVRSPRKTSGYVRRPEVDVWFNPPKVKLQNSHGKEYHAFGKAMSHSYDRSVGFGMEQYWSDTNQFWFPHDDHFTVQTKQTSAKKAMKFERTLAKGEQTLRIELFVPMYSSSQPVGFGEIEDKNGLAEAIKHAARKNHELHQEDIECRMGALVLVEPEAKEKSGGH